MATKGYVKYQINLHCCAKLFSNFKFNYLKFQMNKYYVQIIAPWEKTIFTIQNSVYILIIYLPPGEGEI